MTGLGILRGIQASTFNAALYRFSAALKDEDNVDTLKVGTHILLHDTDILVTCVDGESLRETVLDKAAEEGSYAGMAYVEEDFLDSDDSRYSAPDDGLSWVGFTDLWSAFEAAAGEEGST